MTNDINGKLEIPEGLPKKWHQGYTIAYEAYHRGSRAPGPLDFMVLCDDLAAAQQETEQVRTEFGEKIAELETEVSSLIKERHRLRRALGRFGTHAKGCARIQSAYEAPCDCGLQAVLRGDEAPEGKDVG